MQFHVERKGALGWYNIDRAILMDFGIWCGHDGWEEEAAELTYEHIYGAAICHAEQYEEPVRIRDNDGRLQVEFTAEGLIARQDVAR